MVADSVKKKKYKAKNLAFNQLWSTFGKSICKEDCHEQYICKQYNTSISPRLIASFWKSSHEPRIVCLSTCPSSSNRGPVVPRQMQSLLWGYIQEDLYRSHPTCLKLSWQEEDLRITWYFYFTTAVCRHTDASTAWVEVIFRADSQDVSSAQVVLRLGVKKNIRILLSASSMPGGSYHIKARHQ